MDADKLKQFERTLMNQQPKSPQQIENDISASLFQALAPALEELEKGNISPETQFQGMMKKMFLKLILVSLGTSFIGGAVGALTMWFLILWSIPG